MTEAASAAVSMQTAHQQALAREQQRLVQNHLETAMVASSIDARETAAASSAPQLATRPLAGQKPLLEAQRRQQQQGAERLLARAQVIAQAQTTRAPNAAVAQHQANIVAQQQEASRDPRGRAFRVH